VKKKKVIAYSLDIENIKAIEEKAKADNRSKSDWLNLHLIDLFGKPEKQQSFIEWVTDDAPMDDKQSIKQAIENVSARTKDNSEFERVWSIYEKKGNKKTSQAKFNKLSAANKTLLCSYILKYVKATPNKAFRKNLETFINQEAWNDTLPIVVDKYGKQDVPRSAAYVAPTISDRQAELEKERQAEAQRERNRQKLKQRNNK
jgi:hypothetical protein